MESQGRELSAEPACWAGLAALWQSVATPLRPSPADISFVQQVIDVLATRVQSLRVLLLGVTPTRLLFAAHFDELECRWPDCELGDRCPMMLLQRRSP